MSQERPVHYSDVFPDLQGNLGKAPVAPGDAAMMQQAECKATGHTVKDGPAAAMQAAAAHNERAGHVQHGQTNPAVAHKGAQIKGILGGQHVGSYGGCGGAHGKK